MTGTGIFYAKLRMDEVEKLLLDLLTGKAGYCSPLQGYFNFKTGLSDDTWGSLQLISVYDGQIKGFLAATIDRDTLNINNLNAVKFCDGHDEEFAADMARVFKFCLKHFRAIHWTCASGSPTEVIYGKIAKNFGGTAINANPNFYRLRDGRFADCISFYVPGSRDPDGLTDITEIQ